MDLELILSERAQTDLDKIRIYTLRHWGERQLDRYALLIDKALQSITRNPDIGRSRKGAPTNLKSMRVEKHMIFYVATSKNIEIVRILHENMDFTRHFD